MPQTAAIYGFEFTRPFLAAGLTFQPVESDYSAAKVLARNLKVHKLTGTVSAPELTREKLYHLEGVLSFVEHLEVLVSMPAHEDDAAILPEKCFKPEIAGARHEGGGAVIGSDAFNPSRESRQQFIELALNCLADVDFCERTRFNILLFKCVETFRQRRPFLDISYYLLISGLEGFARTMQSDFDTKNSAVPITRILKHYGFRVDQDNRNELPRAISSYLHIRNALFHQGVFVRNIQLNNSQITLSCVNYLYNLSMLVSLTIMKAVTFDDGHTNWDCWIDRQLLK